MISFSISRARRRFCPLLGALLLVVCPAVGAELTLPRAESLALTADPSVRRLSSEYDALEALSVAAGELPDPMMRLGIMSLPVDRFELDQEPMTQVTAGMVQRFPRGQSRELERRRFRERAAAVGHDGENQRLIIIRTVRELYGQAVLQQRLQALTQTARDVFAGLADITREYYATGRVQQQDVLQVAVELGRIEDQAVRFRQAERETRADLAVFIGQAALDDLPASWPALPDLAAPAALQAGLGDHPLILSLRQQVIAADTAVDLADQRYRPEFTVDVSYGLRSGSGVEGESRPDLLSAMVMMDLPLFHENRQDRVKAARLSQSSAAAFERDDVYRRLAAQLQRLLAAREEVQRRRELFESVLLPQAEFSAEASFEAYQSAVGDLTDLLRARIAEFELGLDHARVQAEAFRLQAQLLYLQGESS